MTTFTREDTHDDTSSLAESEVGVVVGSGSSAGDGAIGSCLDVAEGSLAGGSSLGIPEDDMMLESDVSMGGKEEECTYNVQFIRHN